MQTPPAPSPTESANVLHQTFKTFVRKDIERQIAQHTEWLAENKLKRDASDLRSVDHEVARGMMLYYEGYLEALWSIGVYFGIERDWPKEGERS